MVFGDDSPELRQNAHVPAAPLIDRDYSYSGIARGLRQRAFFASAAIGEDGDLDGRQVRFRVARRPGKFDEVARRTGDGGALDQRQDANGR